MEKYYYFKTYKKDRVLISPTKTTSDTAYYDVAMVIKRVNALCGTYSLFV